MHSGRVIYLNNKFFAQFPKLHIQAEVVTVDSVGCVEEGVVMTVTETTRVAPSLCSRHCAKSITGAPSCILFLQMRKQEPRGARQHAQGRIAIRGRGHIWISRRTWKSFSVLEWDRGVWAQQLFSWSFQNKGRAQASIVPLFMGIGYLLKEVLD